MPTPLPLPVPVAGDDPPALWELPEVAGPGDAVRDILVATPPGYATSPDRRYPVIYLQDGQNLFDPATSYAGHWGLLETLAARGAEEPVILVGIPNLGRGRLREYSPFDDAIRGPGAAVGYLRWLAQMVKPMVDGAFRTLPDRAHTGVGGSSMGGLFALYAVVGAAATFGAAWVMSPALWYADGAIVRWLRRQPGPTGNIWLDIGLEEGDEALLDAREMRDLLVARGWNLGGQLRYLEDPDGDHDEASWGRRVREHWTVMAGMVG
ncbi:MAG: alpha/beta hydrolase [Gemmatimonadales bacterium]